MTGNLEDSWRDCLDLAEIIFVALDAEGRVRFLNRKGCRVLGVSLEEAVGRDWFEAFLPARVRDEVRGVFRRIVAGRREAVEYENPVLTRGGEERLIAWHNAFLRDREGRIVGTLSAGEDVTEHREVEEMLRRSEERYRTLFEESPIPLLEEDHSDVKRYLESLRASGVTDFRKHFGENPQEVVRCAEMIRIIDMNRAARRLPAGKKNGILLEPPENLKSLRDEFVAIAEGKTRYETETVKKTPDGKFFWIHLKLLAVPGYEETLSRVIVSIIDVTERKRYEEQLTFQASLLARLDDAVITVDDQYVVTSWNRAAEEIYGWRAEEAIGRELPELIPSEFVGIDREEMRRILGETGQWRGEVIARRRDGTPVVVDMSSVALRDAGGKITGYLNVNRDITGRKRLEDELRRHSEHLEELVEERTGELRMSEERYRRLFEDSPVSLWEGDLSEVKKYLNHLRSLGVEDFKAYFESHPEEVLLCASLVRVIDVNRTTLRMFNAKSKEELQGPLLRFFSEASLPTFREALTVIAEGGTSYKAEMACKTVTGELRNALLTMSVAPGHEETLSKVIASMVDITEFKRLEAELKEAERLAAIGETATMVGHDLRNPLQVMINLMYLLRESVKTVPIEILKRQGIDTMVESMGRQVEYMNRIVLDLQDYSASVRPKIMKTDFQRLMDETLATLKIPEDVKVAVRISRGAQRAYMDGLMMRRVLTNLLTNAVQAMPRGGRLGIEASRSRGFTSIRVSDTGVGIPRESLGRLFQPLFTTKAKGMGLGLAVCKRLVEVQGGTISVKSRVGEGTTFTIKIPAAPPPRP